MTVGAAGRLSTAASSALAPGRMLFILIQDDFIMGARECGIAADSATCKIFTRVGCCVALW